MHRSTTAHKTSTRQQCQHALLISLLTAITLTASIGLIYLKFLNRRLSVNTMIMNQTLVRLTDQHNQLLRLKNQRINATMIEQMARDKAHMVHASPQATRIIYHKD